MILTLKGLITDCFNENYQKKLRFKEQISNVIFKFFHRFVLAQIPLFCLVYYPATQGTVVRRAGSSWFRLEISSIELSSISHVNKISKLNDLNNL